MACFKVLSVHLLEGRRKITKPSGCLTEANWTPHMYRFTVCLYISPFCFKLCQSKVYHEVFTVLGCFVV
jgi:hypothetical protein